MDLLSLISGMSNRNDGLDMALGRYPNSLPKMGAGYIPRMHSPRRTWGYNQPELPLYLEAIPRMGADYSTLPAFNYYSNQDTRQAGPAMPIGRNLTREETIAKALLGLLNPQPIEEPLTYDESISGSNEPRPPSHQMERFRDLSRQSMLEVLFNALSRYPDPISKPKPNPFLTMPAVFGPQYTQGPFSNSMLAGYAPSLLSNYLNLTPGMSLLGLMSSMPTSNNWWGGAFPDFF